MWRKTVWEVHLTISSLTDPRIYQVRYSHYLFPYKPHSIYPLCLCVGISHQIQHRWVFVKIHSTLDEFKSVGVSLQL